MPMGQIMQWPACQISYIITQRYWAEDWLLRVQLDGLQLLGTHYSTCWTLSVYRFADRFARKLLWYISSWCTYMHRAWEQPDCSGNETLHLHVEISYMSRSIIWHKHAATGSVRLIWASTCCATHARWRNKLKHRTGSPEKHHTTIWTVSNAPSGSWRESIL